MAGKTHTNETKQKMSVNNAMNNPIHRAKVKEAKRGIKWLNRNGINKMAVPGSEKWNMLISEGFQPGKYRSIDD